MIRIFHRLNPFHLHFYDSKHGYAQSASLVFNRLMPTQEALIHLRCRCGEWKSFDKTFQELGKAS